MTLMVAIAGLLVLLFAARIIVVRYILTPEWIDANVVPQIESAIGRQVRFKDISLGFRGLSLEGLRVSDDPAFVRDKLSDFASLDQLVLKLRLLPLLHGRLVIPEIVLRDPLIVVHRNAAGKFNFSSLGRHSDDSGDSGGSGGEDAKSRDSEAGMGLKILAEKLRLQNARVVFVDEAGATGRFSQVELRRLNLRSDGVSLEHPFEMNASMELLTSHGSPTRINLSAQFEPLAPFLGLDLNIAKLDGDQIIAAFEGAPGPASVKDDGSHDATKPAPAAKQTTKSGSGSWDVGAINVSAAAHIGELSVGGVTFEQVLCEAELINGTLSMPKLEARLAGGEVSARSEISFRAKLPAYQAKLSVSGVGLEALAELGAPYGIKDLGGSIEFEARASGSGVPDLDALYKPRDRNHDFSIDSLHLRNGRFSYTRVAEGAQPLGFSELALRANDVRLDRPFDFENSGSLRTKQGTASRFEAMGSFDASIPRLDLSVQADSLNLDEILAALGSRRPYTGEQLAGDEEETESSEAPMPALEASLILDLEQLHSGDLLLSEVHSKLSASGSRVSLDEFTARVAGGNIEANGVATMTSPLPGYRGSLRVRDVSAGEFTQAFWDESRGVLTGTLGLSFDFSGQGFDSLMLRDKLSGKGEIEIKEGRFSGSPLMTTLAAFTGVEELADMRLAESGGTFEVANGKVSTHRMTLGGSELRVVFSGEASLEGALDLEAAIGTAPGSGAPATLDPTLVSLIKADDGWIELPVAVAGTIERPRPSFPARILSAKARELLPQALSEALGGLGTSPEDSGPRGTLAPAAESMRSVLEGIGELLNRNAP